MTALSPKANASPFGNISTFVDAYGHVSLPRFVTVEEFLRAMDRNGIEKAILCTAETCPDIPEVSRAIVHHADRLRSVGVPLGHSYDEIRESIQHQVDCGFIGFRIQDKMIARFPELLDLFGELGTIPWVVGENGLNSAAGYLYEYLEGDEKRLVLAPHFGCTTDPQVLTSESPRNQLFRHPRFLVIFSRQGAYDPVAIKRWAILLVQELGWQHILYGSEFPVCMWRNESLRDTVEWVQTLGISPSEADLADYYGQTALRLLWNRNYHPPHTADEKWSANHWTPPGKVSLLPGLPLEIPEDLHHRLLVRYFEADMQSRFQDYREYLTWVFTVGCETVLADGHWKGETDRNQERN